MTQLKKYTWLIDTIRGAGKISHKELSRRWEYNKDLSDGKPLHRATFNRWRDAIFSQFGIIISCCRQGGYLYSIENPDDINDDGLKKWMLDSFAVGNLIGENLSLKDRIIVDRLPSGRDSLVAVMEAMKANHAVRITYRPFNKSGSCAFVIEPYCVKVFENRWYVIARNPALDDMRTYCFDRIEKVEPTDEVFKLPAAFSASEFFSSAYGIVIDGSVAPEPIVIRADKCHTPYLKSLPLHHSQRLLKETDEYADFGLYLAPTYDFVMKLLQAGSKIEVMAPPSLRVTMREWISAMYRLYENG